MAEVIKKPRNGCVLHGAVTTVEEIKGAVPIIHSIAGCAVQNYLANKVNGLGNSITSGFSAPGTAVQERHIIFGGASRLREQLKNTFKVVNGDLFVVLNGCESAMVGDDVDAMTREPAGQGDPVLDSILTGFHGNKHLGYAQVLTDIIQKLPQIRKEEPRKDDRLVNILGIIPKQDIFYKGELAEIKRILEGVGLKAHTFFGPQNGVEEFAHAKDAAVTLVFSQWGVLPAEKLKELYDIPVLRFDCIPAGFEEISELVKAVAQVTGIKEADYQDFLEQEKAEFGYYMERLEEEFYEEQVIRNIAVVGDERIVYQISGYLRKYLGARIDTAVITDFVPSEDLSEKKKKELLEGLAEEVYLTTDGKEIEQILLHSNAEIVLGSSLEESAAQEKGAVHLAVSYPVYHQTIINKSYAGISGALSLAEDYFTKVKEYNCRRGELLQKFLRE